MKGAVQPWKLGEGWWEGRRGRQRQQATWPKTALCPLGCEGHSWATHYPRAASGWMLFVPAGGALVKGGAGGGRLDSEAATPCAAPRAHVCLALPSAPTTVPHGLSSTPPNPACLQCSCARTHGAVSLPLLPRCGLQCTWCPFADVLCVWPPTGLSKAPFPESLSWWEFFAHLGVDRHTVWASSTASVSRGTRWARPLCGPLTLLSPGSQPQQRGQRASCSPGPTK